MNDRKRSIRIQQALQTWYSATARDLPWRRTTDPYAIWLSEIMLQQTRVPTAIPYYERFLRRFPTVSRLARARLDTVLKMWEGLGYYSRARNLHKAAKEIVSRFQGRLPRTKDDLLTLPGVGRYTAGAISSIAFNERAPLVDGNIERVLCRVFRIHGSPKDAAIKGRIWSLAEELLPENEAGLFNQALMELGSEICSPRRPHCDKCPLAKSCEARIHKEQESLPTRSAKKPVPRHTIVVGVIYRAGRILIDKRKPEGLLGGLWEFPGGKVHPRESLQAALRREIREELDIEIEVGKEIATVEHTYSHFHVEIHAFECAHAQGDPRPLACAALKWVRPRDLSRYAFPAANKKIIEILRRDCP
ncbi:MAG TPA: A/G-specific adenine glycosylase [Sedimentisphaerales bacterium]|nr:A/G-specific adenine glycosylase [Sedimentisphaerales bacterium]